ncbi:hydroxyethylthiazole kinase [Schumannella soli]|uniref:Hydroxyethylthiazole kinase n=1 Tax=Schumannella soli TaxID=2590779 RepID=A0A506XYE5_9MICO|nr:hydroxyethylthiazole kinase [Schumannella soli]
MPPHAALLALRERAPLVQCVTNAVVTNFTANVLLALGAAPAMSDLPGEAGVFAGVADGSLVNLGTPTPVQADGAREVVAATRRWVLDPVAVGALPVRTALAHELLDARPAIIRGNASEVLALAGAGAGGRGVDSVDGPDAARAAAIHLALATDSVVAVSGEIDLVTDGREIVRVPGGDVLLTKVTGGGCSLGATMAAFLGVADALSAAVAASLVHAVAAERAAVRTTGPGSFATAFLDDIAALEPRDLERAEPRLVRTSADLPAEVGAEVTR